MTELDLIVDLHKYTERQGPGSKADTLKALEFCQLDQDKKVTLADMGCGSGGQTLTLAEKLNGKIIAVDLFPQFLEELKIRAKKAGLTNKIFTHEASIDKLNFEKETLDVIWAEGSIYNIGFAKGITYWKQFLKKSAYLVLSEITWTSNSRPKEIEEFWNEAYGEIDTASAKVAVLEKNGFTLKAYFSLSQESWMKYYEALEQSFAAFLDRNNHSDLAKKIVEDCKKEIELYSKFKDYYSYGFYIAQKDD
jgi:ubiquinone/menaquinone biosynthesis C-methylase UbiE